MLQQTTDSDVSLAPEKADARLNPGTPAARAPTPDIAWCPKTQQGTQIENASTQGNLAGNSIARRHPVEKPSSLRVVLLEDNPADAELVLRALRQNGFVVSHDVVETPGEFLRCIRTASYDVVLADYNLPQWRGMEALGLIHEEGLDIPLIIVTGSLGDVPAVECIKQGATDYVLKDGLARLSISVRRALAEKRLREDHKRAQQELARKIEELARSNRELEQFAYVASHDLQEPLRMVATYAQLLAEKYRGKLDDKADKYIEYAVDGALRMQTLIKDLLQFSRIGRRGTERTHIDCNTAVQQVIKNLQGAIQESGAIVTHDHLPTVVADSSELLQLFQNLIGNAVKFRGPETPVIRLRAERQRGEWQFAVSDNGIGISPEHAEAIFIVFKRLHTRAEYAGNGIGLSICRKIIEHHGGRIWVESEPGQGATFKFTLPCTEENSRQGHEI
jgi:signal transduction histidine kinase